MSRRKQRLSEAASCESRGGTSRLLTLPGTGALAITASACECGSVGATQPGWRARALLDIPARTYLRILRLTITGLGEDRTLPIKDGECGSMGPYSYGIGFCN